MVSGVVCGLDVTLMVRCRCSCHGAGGGRHRGAWLGQAGVHARCRRSGHCRYARYPAGHHPCAVAGGQAVARRDEGELNRRSTLAHGRIPLPFGDARLRLSRHHGVCVVRVKFGAALGVLAMLSACGGGGSENHGGRDAGTAGRGRATQTVRRHGGGWRRGSAGGIRAVVV